MPSDHPLVQQTIRQAGLKGGLASFPPAIPEMNRAAHENLKNWQQIKTKQGFQAKSPSQFTNPNCTLATNQLATQRAANSTRHHAQETNRTTAAM